MFIGKEFFNVVRFWYLVFNNLMVFFVDLWEFGMVECFIFFYGFLFVGCVYRKLYRLKCEG